ncbi:MAG: hypothetical protein JO316_21980 [Abitibacteriaceae bacterium]|nr:hypothetical protein [Abditibacteriaceae bacterium]
MQHRIKQFVHWSSFRRSCNFGAALPLLFIIGLVLVAGCLQAQQVGNLLPDPSIEQVQQKNQFGVPYAKWSGWLYEGTSEFRNGKVAHSGTTSAEIIGSQGGKIRLYSPAVTVEPGRYRFTCYIRGLDISGVGGMAEDVNFVDDQYYPLKKTGTFGWTRLQIVKDVPAHKEIVGRIGLWGTGRLWVDDGELVRVPENTPLTNGPVLGQEEKPIAPPGPLDVATSVSCPDCGYHNMPQWGHCYVCGAALTTRATVAAGPPAKLLTSFENNAITPFVAGGPNVAATVAEHATEGRYAMRVDKGYVIWDGPQNWTGYDFFKTDVFNSGDDPASVYIEVRDKASTDYWTRVNYVTVVPPGKSTLVVPTALYVGEKSRPGRALDKANITRFVLNVQDAKAPIYFDNLRLERDLSDSVKVPGLQAFSFGPGTSPPLSGFTAITPSTLYSKGRGYGLKNAQIWRAFDALQPDPLYENFICIESGGFAIDVPDGRYHVFVNIDSPSGYWGEYQVYRQRSIKANGVEVLHETMDLPHFLQRYFRFANVEDRPEENTFDKYQRPYFNEKEFDVDVRGGQLYLEFNGENWANAVSALVIYPSSQASAGQRYLNNLRERRRFYFDNYFKRVLPNGNRDSKGNVPNFAPTANEQAAGYVPFARDWMDNVYVNSVPRREEVTRNLSVFASAGEEEPIVFSLYPLRDAGAVKVSVSDLVAGANRISASAVQMGVVSHRLSRVTMEGTVYTIAPRFIMPRNSATIEKGVTTTFWLTLHTPKNVQAGTYKGQIKLAFANGKTDTIDLNAHLFATPLDELDVPAGPWGSNIDLPWYKEDLANYNQTMFRKCLAKMREYGCTTFSGIPTLNIRGWNNGKPDIDFTTADREMADAKAAGFKSTVINYNGGIGGFTNYFIDENAMKSAGFARYPDFLRAVLTTIDAHAGQAGWLPVAFNLADEPIKDDVPRAAANAQAWREAAPPSILTTGATSVESSSPNDPHLLLARALKIADLNDHSVAAIKAIHDAGSDWAFYNGGNRWTFGPYMYKCAQQYGMKFRLSWHWNAAAGDPFYALDSREDDYSWAVSDANMELIPNIHFEREIREGIDDYRYMLTLSRLLKQKPNHPAAPAARKLLEDKLASFQLGERNHEAKWPLSEYRSYRLQLAEAIEKLSAGH